MPIEICLKRVYDEPRDDDGFRVLVDRLWPRGITKARTRVDRWAKELTPSDALRKWFHADPTRHVDFARRYTAELAELESHLDALLQSVPGGRLTLVTATKDPTQGHAAVLRDVLQDALD